ncbi:MAG: FAD-dependent oxidoreductase [Pseudomonadales bacterium]
MGTRRLAELDEQPFDLVVVGGGITGAGVARHAAQAGLRTLVLDAADFAAGTSSRSTKLIHGGLRYLAMGDIALVRESALERKSLLAMAPHLTEPAWMLVPAASRLQFLKLRIGITLYEWLGAVAAAERHRNWARGDLQVEEPLLDRERLPWACVYREYLTDDARLVLATLRSATRLGALACNYVRVLAVTPSAGGCRVRVVDEITGFERELQCAALVNATGPWVEGLLQQRQDGLARLHLSKGVHLVVSRKRLPVRQMVMMTARDGRPVFAIPRGDVTYLGTTDTSYRGAPDHWPEVLPADVAYLLDTVNAHFQVPPLTEPDVVASWAGLRPLINQPGKAPKEMSRRDEIWRQDAMITVAGGKLTGFRKMAQEAMAAVSEVLGRDVAMPEPLAPLPGGEVRDVPALAVEVARRYQVDSGVARRLVGLYGSEVYGVLGERPTPLSASTFAEEVAWGVEVEGARTLEDLIYRRLRAAWFLPEEQDEVLTGAAALLAVRDGWDVARRESEVARVRERLADELGFAQAERLPAEVEQAQSVSRR